MIKRQFFSTIPLIALLTSNVLAATTDKFKSHGERSVASFNFYKTGAIGETDQRKDSASRPTGALAQRYIAIGTIECAKPSTGGYLVVTGTATVIENATTLVTSAHTFFNKAGALNTPLSNCRFTIRDEKGAIIGQPIQLADVLTLNNMSDENTKLGPNAANDWAVIQLAAPVPKGVVPFQVARTHSINVGDSFHICSFSHDIQTHEQEAADLKLKPCLRGTYKDNGGDTFAKNSYVLFHDISITGWSSGAPMFLEQKNGPPLVFGIQKGQMQETMCSPYKLPYCANYGIFFNDDFFEGLDIVVNRSGGSIYAKPLFKR